MPVRWRRSATDPSTRAHFGTGGRPPGAVAAYLATMLLTILAILPLCIPMISFTVLASPDGGPHHAGLPEPWRVALLLGSSALMMVGWLLAMAWMFFLQN